MSRLRSLRTRTSLVSVALAATAVATAATGVAVAATSSTPSNAVRAGRGISEYGMTHAYFDGHGVPFTYSRGFYCDTTVSSSATSGCEAGATYKRPPAGGFDPLYITVPLGFSEAGMDCPRKLICVDHPGTIDLSRLEKALKPLYPQDTDAQLSEALKNAMVPEHQHFITDTNSGQAEWWDVKVIGVTDKATFDAITAHKSYAYIQQLQREKNKHVTATIPTNLFLYFAAK